MAQLPQFTASPIDLDSIADFDGRVTVFLSETGRLSQLARRVNRLMRGALERFGESDRFAKMSAGDAVEMPFPTGMAAQAVQVIRLERKPSQEQARKAGAAIGKALGGSDTLVLLGNQQLAADIALGCALRAYRYTEMKSEEAPAQGGVTFMASKPEELEVDLAAVSAVAEGVCYTRDLVNKPSNILTTTTFAESLSDMSELGLTVEVLEEDQLEELGMHMLLGVGVGSESPPKVVVMQWTGAPDAKAAPLALIGKGVVFDTGGISLKPAGGMEDMTMDMGGAGTVAGVMRTLALRKARANVVAVVGLVENMPDGKAQRPGDVVTSLKGDTVEVINTDAEGRLVLGDIMWYAQERFSPAGMIDLATLTGAIIVALGHEHAGVFSNDDSFAGSFLKAAAAEGEGAWHMPLGKGYAKLLKSSVADVKNIGGRWGGSVTAAEFLHRFVPEGLPWIHLDIAGVAKPAGATVLAPKGATGWGVMALDRMIREMFDEG